MEQVSLKMWIETVLLPFICSFILVVRIHPLMVKVALRKNIVDKPNHRKLQVRPVPVLGGLAVYWGIVIGAGLTSVIFHTDVLFTSVVALTVMMYMGALDDTLGISAIKRLIFEIIVVAFIVYMDTVNLNHFHGLFGIEKLPVYLSLPLCTVACVGIINAVNMIDGVDGLSSGFCIMACFSFSLLFLQARDYQMVVMAMLGLGSIIPFFFHNVFGAKSKMFIGDSGTMMMGTLMFTFCLHAIDNTSLVALRLPKVGVIAFCLAVLSVPVFDTLRVMVGRILKKKSPFSPDRSHLHHLFLEVGFSYIGTSMMVLGINGLTVFIWFITYLLGGSVTSQFIVVFCVGSFNTVGIYYIVRAMNHRRKPYKTLLWLARHSHVEVGKFFLTMRALVDKY